MPRVDSVLLRTSTTRRVVVEPGDVFFLEAEGDDTLVRKRGREPLQDLRKLGELSAFFASYGFHRIHNEWMVNLQHVSEIRRRKTGPDWEVVMKPPVNRILPVSRARLAGLLAFGVPGTFWGLLVRFFSGLTRHVDPMATCFDL